MRFDTSMFPGITAVLLSNPDERNGRIRIDNASARAFQVNAARERVVVISPGGTKEFDVEGDTFSMGWHVPLDPAHAWPFPDEAKPIELEQQPHAEGAQPDTFIEKPAGHGQIQVATPEADALKPTLDLGEVAGALNDAGPGPAAQQALEAIEHTQPPPNPAGDGPAFE